MSHACTSSQASAQPSFGFEQTSAASEFVARRASSAFAGGQKGLASEKAVRPKGGWALRPQESKAAPQAQSSSEPGVFVQPPSSVSKASKSQASAQSRWDRR